MPSVTLGKPFAECFLGFAECQGHSANLLIPVARVRSFTGYDVNGYRFQTTSHEQSWPNRRTTNTGVFTPGFDGVEYYGRIEEIYELMFHGCKPLNPVIFK